MARGGMCIAVSHWILQPDRNGHEKLLLVTAIRERQGSVPVVAVSEAKI